MVPTRSSLSAAALRRWGAFMWGGGARTLIGPALFCWRGRLLPGRGPLSVGGCTRCGRWRVHPCRVPGLKGPGEGRGWFSGNFPPPVHGPSSVLMSTRRRGGGRSSLTKGRFPSTYSAARQRLTTGRSGGSSASEAGRARPSQAYKALAPTRCMYGIKTCSPGPCRGCTGRQALALPYHSCPVCPP